MESGEEGDSGVHFGHVFANHIDIQEEIRAGEANLGVYGIYMDENHEIG